jgi:hypothetical protein
MMLFFRMLVVVVEEHREDLLELFSQHLLVGKQIHCGPWLIHIVTSLIYSDFLVG